MRAKEVELAQPIVPHCKDIGAIFSDIGQFLIPGLLGKDQINALNSGNYRSAIRVGNDRFFALAGVEFIT